MTKQIWKFTIPLTARDTNCIPIEMPDHAQILTAREQGDALCIWAQVSQTQESKTRNFAVVGTGHELPDGKLGYLGTGVLMEGSLVLHVYEIWDDKP